MAREQQDYDDIPGTFVFDAERSRQGFGINMFCMSLMKDDNRRAFKANEAEYLKKFNLTPEQADAVLKRDYNRMLELGGNIYFTAKLGATDGPSFQHLAATMTGSSQQDYADMMIKGGRNVEGNRSRTGTLRTTRAGSDPLSGSQYRTEAVLRTRLADFPGVTGLLIGWKPGLFVEMVPPGEPAGIPGPMKKYQ